MNERLRQELASIELMGCNDFRDSERIAQHFYNLALGDVRKKIGDCYRNEIDRFKTMDESMAKIEDYYSGRISAADEILSIIDNLTK